LLRALEAGEGIAVWGDYDVDGTTGAATLVSFLSNVGGRPVYYVPHRIEEGYGLNEAGLSRLRASGIRLVVSVDCGISNLREAEIARDSGMDLIIVDHHQPPPDLPPALAILNPHQTGCAFPDKGLCGAGLAFYLIIALRAKLREKGWFSGAELPDLRRYLDIVALGTIADMVPLTGVNRVLTRRGLLELAESRRPGVRALKEVAAIPEGRISAGQVAFQLGPRINAAGRIDAGLKVVEMLTTDSPEHALRIARELDQNNRERRVLEAGVLEEALKEVEATAPSGERYSIAVGREGWHPGVLGIVASRIVERLHRPTIVVGFHDGMGKGSGRSIRGFHMVEGLRRCASHLEKFGGHEYAGGLSVSRENFSLFVEQLETVARTVLAPEDLVPFLEIDALLDFAAIEGRLVRELEALRPFGVGNPEPLFMSRAVEIVERNPFAGGCRFRLRQAGRSLGAVAFGAAGEFDCETGGRIDVVYRIGENEWNGSTTIDLRLVDARVVEPPGKEFPASSI
jgi:single-stranded-DNA-specific exonuclease